MIVSESALKWALRFYPPLFFQRIWVKKFEKEFKGVEVKIHKSFLNINYNRSIFGGTIFSAVDPFYAVCFYQILKRKKINIQIWIKSAKVEFIKPSTSNVYFHILINEDEINKICEELENVGKFVKSYSTEIVNKRGEITALVVNEVYIRKLH